MRYLEAVARCGSIMAAASACHVSQPALSVQLKKLEEELGAKLLVRSARGVTLTPAGERALVSARRVLRELQGLRTDAKLKSFGKAPIVRVAIQPWLATELLPSLLEKGSTESLNGGRLEFRERPPQRLIESVMSGGTELGLIDMSVAPATELCVEEFLRVPYCLYCKRDHPLAQRSRVRLSHLPTHPLILFEHCPGLAQRLQSVAREKGVGLKVPFSTELGITAFEMLAQGLGVAILPQSFSTRASRRQIVARPLEDYDGVARICAVWREGLELSTGALAFIERLRMHLSKDRPAEQGSLAR